MIRAFCVAMCLILFLCSAAVRAEDAGASQSTPRTLPPEPLIDREANKTLSVGPIRLNSLFHEGSMKPIKLEASYSQGITLSFALNYALQNSLPIRITHESANYQRRQLLGNISSALPVPSTAMTYGQTVQNIVSSQIHALQAVYQPTVLLPIFQGGSQFFSMLGQFYRNKGWHESFYTSINDALFDVYQKYENLLLQRTLLQIRAKAVETSEAELRLNNSLYKGGADSELAVMQSRTQLGSDRQALVDQQVSLRLAAMSLAYAMNAPLEVNFVAQEKMISEQSLFDESLPVTTLLDLALEQRPELRQYEYFRLAARRNVPVAAATLYPTASLYGEYTYSETNQTQSFFAAAASGGGSSSTAGAGVFGGLFDTTQGGYALNWNLNYLGLPTVANIAAVSALARQSQMQANQELLVGSQEIRVDYATALTARAQIDNAAFEVSSSKEILRLAEERLRDGSDSNFELVQAESDYFNSLLCQAQAIFDSNVAQAKLLHDIGVISIDSLTHGFKITDKLPRHPSLKNSP